jgi:hypothetical protein
MTLPSVVNEDWAELLILKNELARPISGYAKGTRSFCDVAERPRPLVGGLVSSGSERSAW